MRAWDADTGGSDPADAARRIAGPDGAPPGLPVPAGARTLAFDATGDLDAAQVTAWLRTGDGRDVGLDLRAQAGKLLADLPPDRTAPTHLFALALAEPFDYATRHQHHIGEGGTDVAVLSGTVTLGVPRFPDGPGWIPAGGDTWAGWGSTGAQVTATAQRLAIAFQFTGARV